MTTNEVEETYFRETYRSAGGRAIANVFKRTAYVSTLILVMIALLALVAISPLALRWIGSIHGMNWVQLSNIGQTYGAASALLTGLALIGVAGSMVFQVRAITVSRAESMRGQHAHLIEMALADPAYLRAWGFDPKVYGDPDKLRQLLYINLIVSFWEDHYRLGDIHENNMRGDLAVLFRGKAGREYWAIGRYARLQITSSRKFNRIVEEEYQKAITAGPPTVSAEESSPISPAYQRSPLSHPTIKGGTALLIGAIGGIVFETLLRQMKRKLHYSSAVTLADHACDSRTMLSYLALRAAADRFASWSM